MTESPKHVDGDRPRSPGDVESWPRKGRDSRTLLEELIKFERMSKYDLYGQNVFDEGVHMTSSAAIPWADGVRSFAREAVSRFIHGQNWMTGHGVRLMEQQVIAMMAELFNGRDAVGRITYGGTESNLSAVVTALALAFFRENPNLQESSKGDFRQLLAGKASFNMRSHSVVMPLHSHYSFYKACLLFGLEPIIVPPVEGSLATVDPAAIAAAVRDDTILIVGTAGSWPYGTIDPIKEMSEIALGNEIPMHVDACFGGYILPFLELAGYYDEPLEPWDFRNRGVTTISADCHKNGMAPPPASTLLWRTPDLRDIATLFMLPDGILSGSKGAGPYAATWTTIQSIGLDGYIQLARHSMKLCEEAKAGILSIPGMKIVPGSRCNVFCAYSDTYDLRPVLVEMTKGGWQIPPQEMPGMAGVMGMGIATMPSNDGYIGQLVVDLREAIKRAAVPLGSVHADYPVEAYGLDLSVYPSHPV